MESSLSGFVHKRVRNTVVEGIWILFERYLEQHLRSRFLRYCKYRGLCKLSGYCRFSNDFDGEISSFSNFRKKRQNLNFLNPT